MQYFLKNGQKYINKEPREDMENSIDPIYRCDRHDRHKSPPGHRKIPREPIPSEMHQLANYTNFERSRTTMGHQDDNIRRNTFMLTTGASNMRSTDRSDTAISLDRSNSLPRDSYYQ